MKTILVINMPIHSCKYCPLHPYSSLGKCDVGGTIHIENIVSVPPFPPKDCPLKPMPQKQEMATEPYICNNDWQNGWNDCLERIAK